MFLQDGLDLSTGLTNNCWAEISGTFTPEATSKVRLDVMEIDESSRLHSGTYLQYEFGLASCAFADLYIDGQSVCFNDGQWMEVAELFIGGALGKSSTPQRTPSLANCSSTRK